MISLCRFGRAEQDLLSLLLPLPSCFGQRQSLLLPIAAPRGLFLLPGGAASPLLCHHPPLAGRPVFLAQQLRASAGRPRGPGTKPGVLLLLSPCHLPSPALRLLSPSAAQYRFLTSPLFPLAMVPPPVAGPPILCSCPLAPARAKLFWCRRGGMLTSQLHPEKPYLGQTYS